MAADFLSHNLLHSRAAVLKLRTPAPTQKTERPPATSQPLGTQAFLGPTNKIRRKARVFLKRCSVKPSPYCKCRHYSSSEPSVMPGQSQDQQNRHQTSKKPLSALPPLHLLPGNHFYTYHMCTSTAFWWGSTAPYTHTHEVEQRKSPTSRSPLQQAAAFGRILTKNGHFLMSPLTWEVLR